MIEIDDKTHDFKEDYDKTSIKTLISAIALEENITETEMFYNLADRVQRDRELLRKLSNQSYGLNKIILMIKIIHL